MNEGPSVRFGFGHHDDCRADELVTLHADLLASTLSAAGPQAADDSDAAIARWSEPRKLALDRVDRLLKDDLASAGMLDLAMLSVATAELRTLV